MTTTGKRVRRGFGTVRRLLSGRYKASYVGPDLARHTAPHTFSAKIGAEHWMAVERRLIEADQWVAARVRAQARQGFPRPCRNGSGTAPKLPAVPNVGRL